MREVGLLRLSHVAIAMVVLAAFGACGHDASSSESDRDAAYGGGDRGAGVGVISGVIKDAAGGPVENAIVQLEGGGIVGVVSVFTDATGRFNSPAFGSGLKMADVKATARKIGLQTGSAQASAAGRLELVLAPGNPADEVPASAWLANWPDSTARRDTLATCGGGGCHQFPDEQVKAFAQAVAQLPEADRIQAWRQMFETMRKIFPSIFPMDPAATEVKVDAQVAQKKDDLARLLESPYTGLIDTKFEELAAPFLAKHMPSEFSKMDSYDEGAPWGVDAKTVWREYPVSNASLVREAAASDGRLWFVDYRQHEMVELNPATGEQTRHRYPQEGPSNPHTINSDADGNLWTTLMANDAIARYNPKREEWKLFTTPRRGDAVAHDFSLDYRHRLVRDKQGRFWLSLIGLNRLASFNPDNGEYHEYEAPKVPGVSDFQAALYSVVMTSDKKYLWYSQFNGGVGAYDLEAGQFAFYRWYPKGDGPHRITISKDDVIWVPFTGAGQLVGIDGHTGREIGRYDLPDRNSAPYCATYDLKRNAVWVGSTNSDRWYRFDISKGTFTIYPLPRKNTYFRAIEVDHDTGHLWSAYAHYVGPGRGQYMLVGLDPGD